MLTINSSSEVARVADWLEWLPTLVDVFVVTIDGRTLAVKICLAASVRALHHLFWLSEGIAPTDQVFVFGGKTIGGLPLMEYEVQPSSMLQMSLRLRGGG